MVYKVFNKLAISALAVFIFTFGLLFYQKGFAIDSLLGLSFSSYELSTNKGKKKEKQGIYKKEEPFPLHLKQYAFLLLPYEDKQFLDKRAHAYLEALRQKTLERFPAHLVAISPEAFFRKVQVEFDWKFKYKGIAMPKNELPPELNFQAREGAPKEGFEAGEIFQSSLPILPHLNVFATIGIYEKWISERIVLEDTPLINRNMIHLEEYESTLTGTMKYAMGVKWKFETKKKKKLSLEAFLEQKAHNEWVVKQYLLSHKNSSGFLFDNWRFTFTFDF